MIRRFLSFVLTLVFAAGCVYFAWQTYRLQAEVDRLHAQIAQLKRRESHHGRHSRQTAAPDRGDSEDAAAAEGWLALANRHADLARAAFNRRDFGTAQDEFTQAAADVRRGTQEPVQSAQSTLAGVQRKLTDLQGSMGHLLNPGSGGTAGAASPSRSAQ